MKKSSKILSYGAMFLSAVVALGVSKGVYAEELTVVVNSGASVIITPSVEGIYASTED